MRQSSLASLTCGLMLIICGIVWLVSNLIPGWGVNVWSFSWPLFIMLPGLFLGASYVLASDRRGKYGVLIPAVMLILFGLIFYFNIIAGKYLNFANVWAWSAFMYPAAIALAFLVTWAVSGGKHGFLVPAFVLSIVSVIILAVMSILFLMPQVAPGSSILNLWPICIICVGVFVLFGPLVAWVLRDDSGRIAGKNEQEWEDWGEDIGKRMEKWGKDIGDSFSKPKSEE